MVTFLTALRIAVILKTLDAGIHEFESVQDVHQGDGWSVVVASGSVCSTALGARCVRVIAVGNGLLLLWRHYFDVTGERGKGGLF